MNEETCVERLLPSLGSFLAADPAPSTLTNTSASTYADAHSLPYDVVFASYTRWRRCLMVCRRVVGNDVLFLALLLHAGCLWSPDYAALHAAKASDESAAKGHTSTSARRAMRSKATPAAAARRRGKRASTPAEKFAAHTARVAQAQAAAAAAHAQLTAVCPASVFALHVLHFLRIEEVYAVPATERCSGAPHIRSPSKEDADEHGVAATSDESIAGREDAASDDCDNSTSSSMSSSSSRSSSNSVLPSDVISSTSVRPERSEGAAEMESVMENAESFRKRPRTRSHAAESDTTNANTDGDVVELRGNLNRRRGGRRMRFEDEVASVFVTTDNSPASWSPQQQQQQNQRQWAASSSLLPKASSRPQSGGSSGAKESQNQLDAALAALRQEAVERGAQDTCNDKSGKTAENTGEAMTTRAHTLFLRATVTLVSEEEPLVQQVAAALVDDWIDFFTPSVDAFSGEREGANSDDRHASAAESACPPNPDQQQQQQQREARHYWLSCLLKLVSYVDSAHSSLREANPHLSAVLARQGIHPQEAEDTFSKSLPAILNCVLVEEVAVMHSSTSISNSSSGGGGVTVASCPSAPQLWMPPPVLLLPFHFLGRGSELSVWVPTAGTPGSTALEAGALKTEFGDGAAARRAKGRCVNFTVDSYGLYVQRAQHHAEKDDQQGQQYETRAGEGVARLVCGLRLAEPEALLEAGARVWINTLLPSRTSSSPSPPPRQAQHSSSRAETFGPPRWWCCAQPATTGCVRVRRYVTRTLLMLPIPAQSPTDTTSNRTAIITTTATDISNGTEPPTATERVERAYRSAESVRRADERAARPRRVGRDRSLLSSLSREELAARRQHPHLFHTIQEGLRCTTPLTGNSSSRKGSYRGYQPLAATSANTTKAGGGDAEVAPLLFLYGVMRGPEAAALRQMGFSVRSGGHAGLVRGGGQAGGSTPAERARAERTPTGNHSSSSGRLTLARDSLGVTLEGLVLMARRILALRGLYAAAPATEVTRGVDEGRGKGHHRPVHGKAAASADNSSHSAAATASRACLPAGGSSSSASSTAFPLTAAQEEEVLSTAAVTSVLTALLLTHNLLDELIAQPLVVLWTTELCSFVVDVALLLPRPIPRLLKAVGFSLALVLQPSQSLLVFVGLTATLVTRELQPSSASPTPAAATNALVSSTWQPWWSTFRSVVLRDATLPSCLYGGLWAVVKKAEDAVAHAAAEARWEAATTAAMALKVEGKDVVGVKQRVSGAAGDGVSGGGSGVQRGRGRRVLRLLTTSTTPATTADAAVTVAAALAHTATSRGREERRGGHIIAPSTAAAGGHVLQLPPSSSVGVAAASSMWNSCTENGASRRWLCGLAVLDQSLPPASLVQVHTLRVVAGTESVVALPLPEQRAVVSADVRPQSAAAASTLWLSLEATYLRWPSSTTASS